MNTSANKWIRIAVISLAAGIITVIAALWIHDFNFKNFNTEEFEMKEYAIQENFKNIDLDVSNFDVKLVKASDGKCSVSCGESDKTNFEVSVDGDTLIIDQKDRRKWYEHICFFGFGYGENMTVTVNLPEEKYEELSLKAVSGDIDVPNEFSFMKSKLQSTSGDISYKANTDGSLSLLAVSGDIAVENADTGDMFLKTTSGEISAANCKISSSSEIVTTSGDIELDNFNTGSAEIVSTSGEVELDSFIAEDGVTVKTTSGDITLRVSDAGSFNLKSTSGCVEGSILSPKKFNVSSTSGNIHVPYGDENGGLCEIKTTSGDVNIKIS